MNSKKKLKKREITKNKIISGKGHKCHYNDKYIGPRIQSTNTLCKCQPKCENLFTDNQKLEIFNRYNSLNTHDEQYLLLQSLVIPSKNQPKLRQKFDYFIEAKDNENQVF
jgi:hypothetical protein